MSTAGTFNYRHTNTPVCTQTHIYMHVHQVNKNRRKLIVTAGSEEGRWKWLQRKGCEG